MKKYVVSIMFLFFSTVYSLNYNLSDPQFISLTKKSYSTLKEVKELFKELGLQYLEKEEFTPSLQLPKSLKKDSFYQDNKDENAKNTELYHEKINQKYRGPLQIKWVNSEVGFGVFATKKIKKGDLIQVYTGVVDLKDNIPNKDYCWQYGVKTVDGKNVSCDALHKGNEMRFVNHDDNPNAKVVYVLSGHWHICYVATRDIQPGEQITVSYGKAYWNSRTKLAL